MRRARRAEAQRARAHDKTSRDAGSPDALAPASLESYASDMGLDMGKFKKALEDHSEKAFVDSESAVADKAGISGTPAFIVGQIKGHELTGYFISGAQPFPKFKKLIDKALQDAGEGGGDKDKGDKPEKKAKKAEKAAK